MAYAIQILGMGMVFFDVVCIIFTDKRTKLVQEEVILSLLRITSSCTYLVRL